MIEPYNFRIQRKIERTITNGVGFRDVPRYFSNLKEVNTLLDLRKYLSVMEQNVFVGKNFKRFCEAQFYLLDLEDTFQCKFYREKFNINIPEDIDSALNHRAEKLNEFFRTAKFSA